MMPNNSKQFEGNCESVFNVSELLAKYIKQQTAPPAWLIKACVSQGSIVSLSKPELNINPMSLNTFKKCAEHRIVGGFHQVDTLRKRLKTKPNSKNKTVVKNKNNELHEAQRLRVILTRAYQDLLRISEKGKKYDPIIERELVEHQFLFGQYFGVVGIRDD